MTVSIAVVSVRVNNKLQIIPWLHEAGLYVKTSEYKF